MAENEREIWGRRDSKFKEIKRESEREREDESKNNNEKYVSIFGVMDILLSFLSHGFFLFFSFPFLPSPCTLSTVQFSFSKPCSFFPFPLKPLFFTFSYFLFSFLLLSPTISTLSSNTCLLFSSGASSSLSPLPYLTHCFCKILIHKIQRHSVIKRLFKGIKGV